MKTTLAWLKTHLETGATLDEIVKALVMSGLEVDGIEDRGGRAGPTATVAETNSTRACTHKWRFASAA